MREARAATKGLRHSLRGREPADRASWTGAGKHRILVHVVRRYEAWRVANIIYDSGKSLVSHYRGMRKG
jgi:hypothetical protein